MDKLLNINSKELGRLRDELERQKVAHQVCQVFKAFISCFFMNTINKIYLLVICSLIHMLMVRVIINNHQKRRPLVPSCDDIFNSFITTG